MLGERFGEARGQPVVGAAHALAQVVEPGQREAAVGLGHHFLWRDAPARHRVQDVERLLVVVGEEVAEADLIPVAVPVAGLAHVIAARRREEIRGAHHRHVTRVVHRHLHALDGRQIRLRPAPEPLRRAERALGEEIADALAVGDHLDELHHAIGVVKAQGHAAGVFQREQAALEALHGPGERGPERDGVQAEVVAHLVRLADGDEVLEAEVDAERGERLVLGPAVLGIDAVAVEGIEGHANLALVQGLRSLLGRRFLLFDVHHLLAAHRASKAGIHLDAHLVAHRDGVNLGDLLEGAEAIVERGHAALEVLALHGRARAELVEGAVVLVHGGGHPLGDGGQPLLVGDLHGHLAAHRDGLEALAAHHRAHARAPRHLLQVIGDAGVAHEILAGGADLGHLDVPVAQLLEDRLLHVAGDASPEVGGVPEFHRAVIDPQIDGRGRDAVEDDGVPARTLQLGAPEATRLGLAEPAGERRLGAHAVAAGSRDGGAGDDARRDDQDIVGAQRIGALGDVLEEIVRDEAAPAHVAAKEGVAGLLDPGAPVAEVHVQDLVPVAELSHWTPPAP